MLLYSDDIPVLWNHLIPSSCNKLKVAGSVQVQYGKKSPVVSVGGCSRCTVTSAKTELCLCLTYGEKLILLFNKNKILIVL